jgi:hypothetical protein
MGTNVFGRPTINVLQCYPIGSYNYVGPSSRTQLNDRDEKPPGVFCLLFLVVVVVVVVRVCSICIVSCFYWPTPANWLLPDILLTCILLYKD